MIGISTPPRGVGHLALVSAAACGRVGRAGQGWRPRRTGRRIYVPMARPLVAETPAGPRPPAPVPAPPETPGSPGGCPGDPPAYRDGPGLALHRGMGRRVVGGGGAATVTPATHRGAPGLVTEYGIRGILRPPIRPVVPRSKVGAHLRCKYPRRTPHMHWCLCLRRV
jgi:hypothetical protein